MAQFSRLDVLNQIIYTGVVPVFYHPDFETSKKIIHACADGGAKAIEFTNRGDNAYRVFSDLVLYFAKEDPGVMLGVGSVVDAPTAALYISSGANFVVGPILNPDVARLCNRRKVAYCPGCGSASEISEAEELGVEIIKVFPGDSVGGPQFVKSILGPMPWARIMPTGGVEATQASVTAWIKAGAAAVGMGTHLVKKEWVAGGQYDAMTTLTGQVIDWVRQARGLNLFEGMEHVGFYPAGEGAAKSVVDWYREVFGMIINEGKTGYFVESSGPGRIEVSKVEGGSLPHVAIRVANFNLAVEILKAKGIELAEPIITPVSKAVYFKGTDPAGHRVHIMWRK